MASGSALPARPANAFTVQFPVTDRPDAWTLALPTRRAPDAPPPAPPDLPAHHGGIRFVRYAGGRQAGMAQEVWWSEEHLLASRFTASDGNSSTSYAIDRIRSGVDVTVLLPATDRFPAYRVFDFTDWLERH